MAESKFSNILEGVNLSTGAKTQKGKRLVAEKPPKPKHAKQGYSILESTAHDVDLLAWYRDRSSSSIVQEALEDYFERYQSEIKSAKKLWERKKG